MSLRTELIALGCTSKRETNSVGYIDFYVVAKSENIEPIKTKMYYSRKQAAKVERLQQQYAELPVGAMLRPTVTVEHLKENDRRIANLMRHS